MGIYGMDGQTEWMIVRWSDEWNKWMKTQVDRWLDRTVNIVPP